MFDPNGMPGGQSGMTSCPAPDPAGLEVVAAAVVRGGFVLAARRSRPAHLAGRWEFPGGKVEPGEDGPAALARELSEELGVRVVVGKVLGEASDSGVRLVLYASTLDAGEPAAHDDHDALRWLTASQLDGPDWLPIDRELLGRVREHLAGS